MLKKVKVLVLVSLLFLGLNGNVFADPVFLGGKLERGVSNIYYYVDSSANSYTTLINAAVNNWVITGYGYNPIIMNPVASNDGTAIDFYLRTGDDLASNILGQTSFYNSSETQVSPYTTNWFFAKIELNATSLGQFSDTIKQGTIAHELGHGFGLDHQNSNVNSIMCTLGSGRQVNVVDFVSHNAINTLY